MEEYIEVSAKTKEEAIMNAAIQLGTSSDNIEYDVIQEATSGLFGIGRKPAIIRARKKKDISLDFATIHSNFDLKGYEDNVVATTAFGQGETLVTPLQMAMVTQSIANDGVMLKPYLFKSVVNGKGQTTAEGKSEKLVETMDTDTAQEIKEAMKAAAQSYGMSTVGEKEYSIAAKTGTAERGDGTNNAWLVTFAPADNPQYVIVANRLKTTEIGKTLAPVVEDLYNTLFDAN